jgi:hypothetical protein
MTEVPFLGFDVRHLWPMEFKGSAALVLYDFHMLAYSVQAWNLDTTQPPYLSYYSAPLALIGDVRG